MAVGRTPEERFFEIINQMQDRINQLEARPVQIPVVDADPNFPYAGNIWMFQDGRIHVRLSDGTIQELAGSVSSGPTSGIPKPPSPAQPTRQFGQWYATWSQAYRTSGGVTGGDPKTLYYGNSGGDAYNGRQSSLIGFDYDSIQATLVGGTINKVEIFLFSGRNATVHFGLHDNDAKPVNFGGLVASYVSSSPVMSGMGAYHTVSNQFGSWLRDGLAKGIVLHSPNDSTAFYGYANGVDGGETIPRIRITYTK